MLDEKNCRFFADGKIIELTRKETQLLAILIQNKNRVVTHKNLEEALYGIDEVKGGISNRISVLRKKLKGVLEIKTKIGLGYYI